MRALALLFALLSVVSLAACARGQLVPPDAAVERVASGYRFTEGPALGPDGAIYFSDTRDAKVHRFDPATGEADVFLADSGGSNGLAFATGGRLVLCEQRERRVTVMPLDGERRVVADFVMIGDMERKRLNSPNDLVVTRDGLVYFTDPRYGKRDSMELDFEAVFVVPLTGSGYGALPIIRDLERPNGIAISPDDTTLYVADNGAGTIVAYDLGGRAGYGSPMDNGREFARPAEGTRGGPDGLTVDRAGNVYAAWHGDGAVHVWSPGGEPLGRIEIPRDDDKPVQPTNVAFAADGETLYITAGGGLYRVKLNIPR